MMVEDRNLRSFGAFGFDPFTLLTAAPALLSSAIPAIASVFSPPLPQPITVQAPKIGLGVWIGVGVGVLGLIGTGVFFARKR